MDQKWAEAFIVEYFRGLFVDRNLTSLDTTLAPDYWDDDIGDPNTDHIQNSKEFLANLFHERPTIGVDVGHVMTHDETIVAYLTWHEQRDQHKTILMKGIAIFEMENKRIKKRHTYIYEGNM